jgi:MFS family permease
VTTRAPATAAVPAAAVPAAWREPAYLRYLAGRSVSWLGDQAWSVALAWAAVRLASPGVAGLVLAASSVPRLVLMLFGGPLADRWDARRLMLASDALRAVVTLVAAALAVAGTGLPLLVTVALVFGVVDAVFLPAAGSVQPRLLRPGQYAGGAALGELANRAALTLGAPLGGLLVAFGGLPLGCLVDAATFVASMLFLWTVHPRPLTPTEPLDAAEPARTTRTTRAKEPYLAALRGGLAYLVRDPLLRTVVVLGFLANVAAVGPLNVGVALVSQERGWGAGGIGALLAGFGIGAAAGAVVMLRWRIRRYVGVAASGAAVAQGLALAAVGAAPAPVTAVGAMALVGLTSGVLGILLTTLTQTATADAYRGRVSSVTLVTGLGVTPLVMAVFGALVSAAGLAAVFAGCGALAAAAALAALLVPAYRRATG